jgi:hypothetical protein
MIVSELIQFLQTFPQDLPVAYDLHSEQCLMEPGDIEIRDLCLPREDGWVANPRPDKPSQTYLVFPGN